MKYFKKIYKDKIACGCWDEGDAINYNKTTEYDIEFINEKEYLEIKKNVYINSRLKEIDKKLKILKINKYTLETINEDVSEIINEINSLENERDEITV